MAMNGKDCVENLWSVIFTLILKWLGLDLGVGCLQSFSSRRFGTPLFSSDMLL